MHGQIKVIPRSVVENVHGRSPTVGTKSQIRGKVEGLLECSTVINKNPAIEQGIFLTPALQAILSQVWFGGLEDDERTYSEFSFDGPIPIPTIGLVSAATERILGQWVTGESKDQGRTLPGRVEEASPRPRNL